MPQEYQDPLQSVLQGMLQGHQIATQIHRQKQEDEAFMRHNAQMDREAGIQDIMNRMHLQDLGARQVQNGMVTEQMPGLDVGAGVTLPGSSVSGSLVRKARGGDTVKLKGPQGETAYELPTPEEQIKNQISKGNALEDAKVSNEMERAAKIRQNTLKLEGGGVPAPAGLETIGVAPGTRLTRAEVIQLSEAAQKIRKGNLEKLGEGDTLVDTSGGTATTVATGAPKRPTGDFQQVYLPAFAAKLGKTPATLTPEESLQAFQQHATDTKDPATLALAHQMTQANLEMTRARIDDLRSRQNTTPMPINPGTREYRIAQDLAYGKLTMQQFRSLTAYSRDTNKKMDIYDKAAELNPQFNPASFEMGFGLAKNPKVQQQLASLDNVKEGVADLLKFSDQASRSGITTLNKFILPGGVAFGGKKYSNFRTAQLAFADELSGGLGFGSATDMSREMGLNMTDPNMTAEQFRSAVQDVVVPFVERKRSTLLKQMGPYGMPGMNPGAPVEAPAAAGGGTAPKTAAEYLKSIGGAK